MLLPILKELSGRNDVVFIMDERMDVTVLNGTEGIIKVRPTIWSRLKNEICIRGIIKNAKRVLCMGSLPPLLGRNDEIIVFMQNRYLLDKCIKSSLPMNVRMRLWIEQLWLRMRCDKVSRFVVQTDTMANFLLSTYHKSADIIPFIPNKMTEEDAVAVRESEYDFIYVASGEAHKNHMNLVKAWTKLAGMGLHPKLCLTISKQRFPDLCAWIEGEKDRYGLDITNMGELEYDQVQELYRLSRTLIYPSLFESFGLPLIEAVSYGIPVLAADRDYVHDLMIDVKTFDAASPESIAKAVTDFDYEKTSLAIDPCTANQFLKKTVFFTSE